ncbi:pyruvate dehydrogenase E1 component alpha subunit [Rhodoligotrophos appendicifer]
MKSLFADGEVPGFVHLSIGQEAVPVGISASLRPSDTIASNHRGHGHALAKGIGLDGFFAEVMGRSTGICKGRGGSMHVADLSIGMLGANGIVGAGIPIAAGSALAHKVANTDHISVAYFGDGALAEGVLHETLNIASLWSLPMLFVCENNGWSEFSPTKRQMAASLEGLAAAFNIPYSKIDGNDVVIVAEAAARLIGKIRQGAGVQILECETTRVRGHFEGDKQDYREADELQGLNKRDPILNCRLRLEEAGRDETWFQEIEQKVADLIDGAVNQATAASEPDPMFLGEDVYTPFQEGAPNHA